MGKLWAVAHRLFFGAVESVLRLFFGDAAIIRVNGDRWFGIWRENTSVCRSIYVRMGRTEIVMDTRAGLRRLQEQREQREVMATA